MSIRKMLIATAALAAVALTVALCICLSPSYATVDFRGYVTDISFDGTGELATITATDVFDNGGCYTVLAEEGIRVTSLGGAKMSLSDIKPGDMIDLDYKRKTGSDGTHYAKWISVCPSARP